jgi:hypothetical protein
MSATGNTTAAVLNYTGNNYIRNATLVGTEFGGAASYTNNRVYSNQHDGSAGNHYICTDNGVIQSQDGPTYGHTTTAGTICWKLSPTNVIRNSNYPLDLTIAKIACVASKEVTVKAWMKLTSTTDILGALVCRQGQLAGLTTIAKTNTGTADTSYHEVTLTFTPTEAGVVEIQAWAWWVAGDADESVYIDDMTISQAA